MFYLLPRHNGVEGQAVNLNFSDSFEFCARRQCSLSQLQPALPPPAAFWAGASHTGLAIHVANTHTCPLPHSRFLSLGPGGAHTGHPGCPLEKLRLVLKAGLGLTGQGGDSGICHE